MSDTNPGFQPFGLAGGLYDGEARTFYSFYQAADEPALSRLYGGIHFMPAIELGLMQGKCIGAKVNHLPWKQ